MNKTIKDISIVPWPDEGPLENFQFDVNDNDGNFTFKFKWLNERWHCWVTMPNGTVREAGVYPNVFNWTGTLDFGLIFSTTLESINFDTLYLTEIGLVKWL